MTARAVVVSAGAALLFASACVSSPPPTGPSLPPPDAPGGGVQTTGRVVSATSAAAIQGANLEVQGLGPATTDSSGYFQLFAPVQNSYSVLIRASSSIDRQTTIRVPGADTEVSLIPASVDLQFFNEMCRGFGGRAARWTHTPVLVVESSVIEYSGRTATDEEVPAAVMDPTIDKMRRILPTLSAGRFADFAAIERRVTPVGGVSTIPTGAIVLSWQRNLATGFGHVAYGARASRGSPDLAAGEVALDADWHIRHLPAGSRTDYDNVLNHELGHSLGYNHTTIAPSFMYEVFLMGISAKDREAFNIFFQRPSGNVTPDTDPSGSTLNVVTAGSELVPIP